MLNQKPTLIQKESVPSLNFPCEGLPRVKNQEMNLTYLLKLAVQLGNGYKEKIKIIFQDSEGIKMVETTVWQATPKHIVLKGAITIPFNRVVDIQLQ